MELIRELTLTTRSLARRPGFAATVILTLALGLAAAVGLYSVARSVLLEPLPYTEASRLVAVFGAEEGSPRGPMAPADFADLSASASTLSGFAAAHPWSAALTGFEVPERIPGLRATAGLFDLLGVEAAVGRTFLAEEGTPGRDRVVVLSWDLWQRRFGGDRSWLGRSLTLDGEPHVVVGVMPRGFGFPPFWAADAELWVPLALDADNATERNARFLRAFARLAPGADLEAARREAAAVAARIAAEHPSAGQPLGLRVEPLLEPVVGDARPVLLVLVAGGLLLYLIAATNVAGLFVARRVDREPEMALRAALGAGRGRLLRPWLLEASVLGAAGAVLGALGAAWGLRALVALAPADLPRRGEIVLDGGALAAAALLALLPCLAAALVAGAGGRRAAPRIDDARTVGGARARLRGALVVGQVALATSLLLAAGLAAAALAQLAGTDPGLRRAGLLTASLSLAASPHGEPERQPAFLDELVAEAESLPGVEGAAVVNHLPVAGDTWGTAVLVEGEDEPRRVVQRVASERYFSVVGTPLVAGRTFSAEDRAGGAPVVVVNRRLARLLPGGVEAAVGQLLRSPQGDDPPLRVVGVVGDSVQGTLGAEAEPEIVYPYAQNPNPWFRQTSLVVAVRGEPEVAGRALRRRLAELAPDAPLYDVRPMRQVLADDLAGPRWTTLLLALFAAAALGLSVVGLYGVLAFLVGRRRRELGLRLVLGASRRRLLAREVRRGIALAAGGLALGLAGGGAAAGLLAARLPGFTAERPAVFAALAAVVLATAAAAAALPAARALAADPARALRDEA